MDRRSFVGRLIAGAFSLSAGSAVVIQEATAADLNRIDGLMLPLEEGVWLSKTNLHMFSNRLPRLDISFTGDIRQLMELDNSLTKWGKTQLSPYAVNPELRPRIEPFTYQYEEDEDGTL